MTTPSISDSNIAVLLMDYRSADTDELYAFLDSQPDIDLLGRVRLGQDDLEPVRDLRPDVVIVRAGNSEFSGVETSSFVRMQMPEAKVVMVSATLSPDNLFLALGAGIHGYVLAEAGSQAVVNAVRAVPVGAVYLSSEVTDTLVADYTRRNRAGNTGNPFTRLSKREREVFRRLVNGETTANIALELALSPKTVETYRRRLMHKLGVTGVPALVRLAVKHGVATNI